MGLYYSTVRLSSGTLTIREHVVVITLCFLNTSPRNLFFSMFAHARIAIPSPQGSSNVVRAQDCSCQKPLAWPLFIVARGIPSTG